MKTAIFAAALMASSAAFAQTAAPERDARGIPVVSDAATTPAGANQMMTVPAGATVVAAPNQGQVFMTKASTETAPPCTRERTDRCVQTYERGRR